MNEHYTEADLLETYYMQPGESMPVMMHLASCGDCAARYERLERKLREAASCETERPATFWSRQRLSIMKRIGDQRIASDRAMRPWRVAAAAALTFILGGAVVYKSVEPSLNQAPVVVTVSETATPAADDDTLVLRDPWQSEELQDFHGVVEWESWVDAGNTGGKS